MTQIFTIIDKGNYISIGNGTSTGLVNGKSDPTENLEIPEKINFKNVLVISSYAFQYYRNLKSVLIRAKIETLGTFCFHYCTNLLSINIPSSVKRIENNAFDDCYLLNDVTFESPSSLKIIKKMVFNTCNNLTKIFIPSSVKEIEYEAFSDSSCTVNIYYCGKRTFEGSIRANQSAKIIVPFGGVKTFGGRATTEEPLMCPEYRRACTRCSNRRNSFSLALFMQQLMLS